MARGDGCQAVVLGLLAGLATFRLVLQAFIVKEDLLAHGPNKRVVAIYTLNRSILKVRRLSANTPLRPAI